MAESWEIQQRHKNALEIAERRDELSRRRQDESNVAVNIHVPKPQ